MNTTNYLQMISIHEVANLLGVQTETAIRWLQRNHIQIHTVCKQKKVFQIEVAVAIDLLFARALLRKYPLTWEPIYRLITHDTKVCEMVIAEINGITPPKPQNKIKPLTDSDKKLLKKLQQ